MSVRSSALDHRWRCISGTFGGTGSECRWRGRRGPAHGGGGHDLEEGVPRQSRRASAERQLARCIRLRGSDDSDPVEAMRLVREQHGNWTALVTPGNLETFAAA